MQKIIKINQKTLYKAIVEGIQVGKKYTKKAKKT